MFEDPIIEELHKVREEIAAEHNYDMHVIVAALRRSRQESNRQSTALPPRQVANVGEADEKTIALLPKELGNNQSLTPRVS